MLRATRLLAAVAVAAAASGASAAPPRPAADVAGQAARAAALATQQAEELRLFARDTGMTLAQAGTYLAAGPLVDEIDARARARYGTSFAGVWRDPADPLRPVHVAFVGDAGARAAAVTAGLPRNALVRAVPARLTLAQLAALTARVTRDLPRWSSEGVRISQVAEDLPGNAVVVTVPGVTPAQAAALTRAYGAGVRVEDGTPVHPAEGPWNRDLATCLDRSRCLVTMRGGLETTAGGHQCTTGFSARKGGADYVLTAGHCFAVGDTVTHGGLPLGTVDARRYSGTVDGESYPINAPVWYGRNWVYYNDTAKTYVVEEVAGRTVRESVGAPVCRTGVTTGVRCGTVQTLNATVVLGGSVVLTAQRISTGCALPGDSGGSVVYDATAYGVVSGSNFTRNAAGAATCRDRAQFTYSGIAATEKALGVQVKTA